MYRKLMESKGTSESFEKIFNQIDVLMSNIQAKYIPGKMSPETDEIRELLYILQNKIVGMGHTLKESCKNHPSRKRPSLRSIARKRAIKEASDETVREAIDIVRHAVKEMMPDVAAIANGPKFSRLDIEIEDCSRNADYSDYNECAEADIYVTVYGYGSHSPEFQELKKALKRLEYDYEGGDYFVHVGEDQSYISTPQNHIVISALCNVYED